MSEPNDSPNSGKPYPDYITCPHCGEPEVEVWSDQKEGHCHHCGKTFPYPPANESEQPPPAANK